MRLVGYASNWRKWLALDSNAQNTFSNLIGDIEESLMVCVKRYNKEEMSGAKDGIESDQEHSEAQ